MNNQIDANNFVKDFIDEYVKKGFGTLAKRDLEIFLFHLLYKHGYFGNKANFFEISKMLRISEVKVRNLYQDVQLRYDLFDEKEAKERFVKIIERQRFEVDNNKRYKLQIRDPLLRQYIEEWVDSVNGISDSSFTATIIVISREVFVDLLEKLTPYENIQELRDALPDEIDDEVKDAPDRKSIFSRFLDKYVETIAEQAAKETINLAGLGLKIILGLLV